VRVKAVFRCRADFVIWFLVLLLRFDSFAKNKIGFVNWTSGNFWKLVRLKLDLRVDLNQKGISIL